MANYNRNYNSGGSSLGGVIALLVVAALLVLFIGWGSSWYTDWSFSKLTETVGSWFSSDDDTTAGTDDGDSSTGGTSDSDSSGSSSSSGDSSSSDSDSSSDADSTSSNASDSSSDNSSSSESGSDSDSSSDNNGEIETYTINWVEGSVASGYSFDYDCPTEAQAGDTVTITISNTAGGSGKLYFQIVSDDGTRFSSGALTFGSNTYSFTMPEGNVTVTCKVTTTSGGAA